MFYYISAFGAVLYFLELLEQRKKNLETEKVKLTNISLASVMSPFYLLCLWWCLSQAIHLRQNHKIQSHLLFPKAFYELSGFDHVVNKCLKKLRLAYNLKPWKVKTREVSIAGKECRLLTYILAYWGLVMQPLKPGFHSRKRGFSCYAAYSLLLVDL